MPTGDAKPTVPSVEIPSNKGAPQDAVTPRIPINVAPPQQEQHVVGREEKVEYRDQDGNLLDDDTVASLLAEGKASFSTLYQTETKLVDEYGNLIPDESSVAPEHPDAEGANPDTKGQAQASSVPANAEVSIDDSREEELKKPKPASDASAATK